MAKVESFDELIEAIQEAFLSVERMAQKQHLESLKEFLEEDGMPKMVRVKYPIFTDEGLVSYQEMAVPQLILVPISTLKLSEVSVDFKVKLTAEVSLSDKEEEKKEEKPVKKASPIRMRRRRLGFIPRFLQKKEDGYANITLKFQAEEAPEGMLRIRDEMIKILP